LEGTNLGKTETIIKLLNASLKIPPKALIFKSSQFDCSTSNAKKHSHQDKEESLSSSCWTASFVSGKAMWPFGFFVHCEWVMTNAMDGP